MRARILALFLLALLPFAAISAQSDEQPEDPRALSYQVCDWGLIVVENPTEQPAVYIDITSPTDYSAVGSSFTVSGTGAGLPENNVNIEVSAFGGEVLFTGSTVLQSDAQVGSGPWSMDIDLADVAPNTEIFVAASALSPESGMGVAYDSLRLNANAEFGLRFVEITHPYFGEGVPGFMMRVEGMAGGAFENNVVVQVMDQATGAVLAEAPVTVQTNEVGGSGPFSVEFDLEVEPGTPIEVVAFQPAVADGEEVSVSDIQYAVVDPLARTYERMLNVQASDPILGAPSECDAALAEFDNTSTAPLAVDDVTVFQYTSPTPFVNLSVHASGSSNCPAPLRSRIFNDDNHFTVEVYLDTTYPVPCTADLVPITQRLSLGTLPNPDYTVTV